MASVDFAEGTSDPRASDPDDSLPQSTLWRFDRSIRPLAEFPLIGSPLPGRWSDDRYLLDPWRWMLVVYEYHEADDLVAVVTIQDGRSARAATISE